MLKSLAICSDLTLNTLTYNEMGTMQLCTVLLISRTENEKHCPVNNTTFNSIQCVLHF